MIQNISEYDLLGRKLNNKFKDCAKNLVVCGCSSPLSFKVFPNISRLLNKLILNPLL